MAEIPRIQHVAPAQSLSQQNYVIQRSGDRQGSGHPHHEEAKHEDVVELHDEHVPLDNAPVVPTSEEGDGHLDLAV